MGRNLIFGILISLLLAGGFGYWYFQTEFGDSYLLCELELAELQGEISNLRAEVDLCQYDYDSDLENYEEDYGYDFGSTYCSLGLMLPQVYIASRYSYLDFEIDDLYYKAVDPLVNYYDDFGWTVVSIEIYNSDITHETFEAIDVYYTVSANDYTDEPVVGDFTLSRVDGVFPYWSPGEVDPGFY